MVALLSIVAVYAGLRFGRAAYELVRRLPRNNEDLVFF